MSFVRPEIKRRLLRWREAVAGAVLFSLGAWQVVFGYGLIPYVGFVVAFGGAILLFTGFQRARIRAENDGPGLVEILERQVTYFAAVGGISFSLDDVRAINIETTGVPGAEEMTWVFDIRGEGTHHIPGNAVGADKLFDVLASFIGADTGAVIRASGTRRAASFPVWEDKTKQLH